MNDNSYIYCLPMIIELTVRLLNHNFYTSVVKAVIQVYLFLDICNILPDVLHLDLPTFFIYLKSMKNSQPPTSLTSLRKEVSSK